MNHSKNFKILIILVFVACLSGFVSDIYVPSFLTMAKNLDTSLPSIQHSMSIFMLSLSITQLIYGPLSEIIGRRISIIIGLFIMVMGSSLCVFSENFTHLIVGRFMQGVGAGACACLWRAIFRDIFTNEQMTKYGGYLGIAMVYVVAASPFLGGYFETYANWRISFLTATFYGIILFFFVYYTLPETNTHHTRSRFDMSFFLQSYKQLLKSSLFMGYSLCVFFTYGAFFSWFIVGPVVCMTYFNVSPQSFGWLNLTLGGTAMALGGIFNGRNVVRFGQEKMLRIGWSIMIMSGLLILVLSLLSCKTVFLFLICIFMFLFGVTLIWPNAFSKAFSPFGAIAGYASGLYSAMQLVGGAAIGGISALIPSDTPYALAVVFITTGVCAWVLFECVLMKKFSKKTT